MKTIKQLSALAIVAICIMAGGILLVMDFDSTLSTWLSVVFAFMFFALALALGIVFDRKHLLPE